MLAEYALEHSGNIVPLVLPFKDTNGTALMNPSIFNDNGKLLVNIRHINYVLYHCHNFFHEYGPLQYIHPEHDHTLRTFNIIAELDPESLKISKHTVVDTSLLDTTPQWNFIGLEDARLFKWEGKLYLCGVRRDTTPHGVGRMELSELDNDYRELKRYRIEGGLTSYCEKNWMPILDRNYSFIKWTSPTEIVHIDTEKDILSSAVIPNNNPSNMDLRGGSHVIPWNEGYLAIVHESYLLKSELNQKDAVYKHRMVYWDKHFNIIRTTKPFTFLAGKIEFCCGMTTYGDDVLISFGRQDNSAYVLRIPIMKLDEYLWNN